MKIIKVTISFFLVIIVLGIPLIISGSCAGPEKSDRFSKLLSLIPADENVTNSPVMITDYASAFESVGISLAELDEQSVSFQEFTDIIREKGVKFPDVGSGSFATGWGSYASIEIIREKNIGYNFTSANAEIQVGMSPNLMMAAIGRYDPVATRDALQNQGEWPDWAVDAYSTEEYHGVTIHTWGDGHETNLYYTLVPPHIDMLGRATPLAVTDGYLFNCVALEYVKAMIDASQGRTESLVDLPEYADVADELSGLDVYTAIIGTESITNGDPQFQETYSGPRLRKFLTFGVASGTDENGDYAVFVLYHDNHDDAEANIPLFRQRIDSTDSVTYEMPWSDLVTDTKIYVKDNLLVAKLYTDRKGLWVSWLYAMESILLHEK